MLMKNNLIRKISFLLLLLSSLSLEAQDIYKVKSLTLNVRSKPSVRAPLIGKLRQHETVEVISKLNGWANVKYKKRNGYVSMKHLTKHSLTDETSTSQLPITETEKGDTLASPLSSIDKNLDLVIFTDGSSMDCFIKEITEKGVVIEQQEDNGELLNLTLPIDAISLIEYSNGEVKRFEKESTIPESPLLTSKNKNSTFLNSNKNSKWHFIFMAGIQGGYSNYLCNDIAPKPTIGFGGFASVQLTKASGKQGSINGYFSELSIGYAWKGSGAYPIHYGIARLSPAGWRFGAINVKIGAFCALPFNSIDTDYESFQAFDFGVTGGVGFEHGRIGITATYEQGLADVGTYYTKLNTQAAFLSLTYRFF